MSKYLPACLGMATVFFASTAFPIERSELEKSSIKAATDCVAQAALKNPDIITLHRKNRLNEVTDWIVLRSNVCDKSLTAMRLHHEQIYGKGSGRLFLQGSFLADLPRAVGERIGIELANRALQSPEISGSFGRAYPGPYDPRAMELRRFSYDSGRRREQFAGDLLSLSSSCHGGHWSERRNLVVSRLRN